MIKRGQKKFKFSELDLMIKSISLNNLEISDEILQAFRICDRCFFVKEKPYIDHPIHIAHGQTISQPSTIARITRLLKLEKGFDVLEIGTNTGYHAGLTAYLVYPGKVATIEIFPDLAKRAEENIQKLKTWLDEEKNKEEGREKGRGKTKEKQIQKFSNIRIFAGDALDKKNIIWKNKYDRIYFTAGVEPDKIAMVKEMGLKLLKKGGLLLYPTRESWDWGALEIWQKNKTLKIIMKEKGYAFVPLLRQKELEELYRKKKKN